MSKSRNLADLLDANGDVLIDNLDNVDALPDQTGQSGNYLTTNGTAASWGAVDLSTKVDKSGDTMTGNLNFGDNVKAVFGAGSDLEIYHDGGHSSIKENHTSGNLYLQANNAIGLFNNDRTEAFAKFFENGACELYYDNSKKLATTSTGVSVTGDLAVSGSISGAGKVLQVVSTTFASTATTTSTSYQDSGHSATITPSSTSSKILVMAVYSLGSQNDQFSTWSRLVRGATTLSYMGSYANAGEYQNIPTSQTYLDSPSTTSATTYKVQFRTDNSAQAASYGHPYNKNYGQGTAQFTSTLTLMEIAG